MASTEFSLTLRQGVDTVERFRILVIGNANAGKTTILKNVCHTWDRNPVYLDDKGNKVRHAHLEVADASDLASSVARFRSIQR
jgi:septin family protein